MREPVPARLARAGDPLARAAPFVLILAGVLRAASTFALGSPADSPRSPEQAAQAASSAVAGSPPPPAAGTVLYRIDPNRSTAKFEMPATLHTVIGRTTAVSGEFSRPAAAAPEGFTTGGRILIAAGTIETGNATRDRRMRSESLDVVRYPDIVFVPKRAAGAALSFNPGATVRFTLGGDLTIRGITKPVALEVTARPTEEGISADGTTTLSFPDFGVPDPSNFLLHVKTTLRISVHVEASVVASGPLTPLPPPP